MSVEILQVFQWQKETNRARSFCQVTLLIGFHALPDEHYADRTI